MTKGNNGNDKLIDGLITSINKIIEPLVEYTKSDLDLILREHVAGVEEFGIDSGHDETTCFICIVLTGKFEDDENLQHCHERIISYVKSRNRATMNMIKDWNSLQEEEDEKR